MAPGPALLGAFLVLAIVIGVGSFLFGLRDARDYRRRVVTTLTRPAQTAPSSDMYKTLDVLAQKVGILGIFSDWRTTVTYYANCMGLK